MFIWAPRWTYLRRHFAQYSVYNNILKNADFLVYCKFGEFSENWAIFILNDNSDFLWKVRNLR